MSVKDAEFWRRERIYPSGYTTQHEKTVKMYERGITITHPNGAKCWCGDHCPWRETEIKYYKYKGESI